MADVGLRKIINGPEAFTPDNEFLLGETDVDGFFVAAGFCAHGIAGAGGIGQVMAEWIVSGDPGMDLWHMDVRRFGRQYRSPSYTLKRTLENYETYYDIVYPGQEREAGRPLRTPPAYDWHVAARGVVRREVRLGAGELLREQRRAAVTRRCGRTAGPGRLWSPAVGVEHRATREAVALFDESSFAKLMVTGPDAADLLQWVCDNDVARGVGDITYTQALNARGGIESDFTVTRLADDAFLVVTGTAFGVARRCPGCAGRPGAATPTVRVDDVTGQLVTYALWGPRSRDVLRQLTGADLSNAAFPFMTAQEISVERRPGARAAGHLHRRARLGAVRAGGVRRARSGQRCGRPGRQHGIVAGGYRAIESLRLEKGYRVWSTDITARDRPVRGGARLLREARQAGRLRGPGRAGGPQGAGAVARGCAASPWPTRGSWSWAASRSGWAPRSWDG